jgi:hypothetical protein
MKEMKYRSYGIIRRMASSGMLRRVALVRTDVSEEVSAPFIRVTGIGELGTTLAVTSNRRGLLVTANAVLSSPTLVTLMKVALSSSETSVLTRATRRNIPADAILHSPTILLLLLTFFAVRMLFAKPLLNTERGIKIAEPLSCNERKDAVHR